MIKGGMQNADIGGKKDLLWEEYTEAFANGLDIVAYNYMESRSIIYRWKVCFRKHLIIVITIIV